jgi:hypothetical protein
MTAVTEKGTDGASHWVRWHQHYQDLDSPLSVRLRLVQAALRRALDSTPPGPVSIVSLCAGQGRDVIDVLAEHPRAPEVRALLVELDPELVAFARTRAEESGVADHVTVIEGDASHCRWYAEAVPAQVVLVCGVFGNISDEDIRNTVHALPSFCAPGATVIWTRHRRAPDKTPDILRHFGDAGFELISFDVPDGYVLSVGAHRYTGGPTTFDPDRVLFTFTGDGILPA